MTYKILPKDKKDLTTKLDHLNNKKITMVAYLKMKMEEQDWHAVSDAAVDIREIDASIRTLKGLDYGK